MADIIQHRRDTLENWSAANPILADGEMGIVTDDPNKYKIGDGVHTWNELKFRGFDGTFVQEINDSETAAPSSNAVLNKINDTNLQLNKSINSFILNGSRNETLNYFFNLKKDIKYTIYASSNSSVDSEGILGMYFKHNGNNLFSIILSNQTGWQGNTRTVNFIADKDYDNVYIEIFNSCNANNEIKFTIKNNSNGLDVAFNELDTTNDKLNVTISNLNKISNKLDIIPIFDKLVTLNKYNNTIYENISLKKGQGIKIEVSSTSDVNANIIGFYLKSETIDLKTLIILASQGTWIANNIRTLDFIADKDYDNLILTNYNDGANFSSYSCNVKINIYQKKNINFKDTIYVASKDISFEEKLLADFVCDGKNDEKEINEAIKQIGKCGTVKLSQGRFYIDKFYHINDNFAKSAIYIDNENLQTRSVKIQGVRHYFNGTKLIVNQTAFDEIPVEEQPCVINVLSNVNINGTQQFWYVSIQDLFISIPTYRRKCIIINLANAGCGEQKNLRISAFGDNDYPEFKPSDFNAAEIVEGLIGIRSYHGWTYGDTDRMDNISIWGCYEAFQLGGEHLICNNLRARFNHYGYTFGNYKNDINYGAFDHPITLINCCDEQNQCLPLFNYCGLLTDEYNAQVDKHLQGITFIDFNTEQAPNLAEETTPGMFCGIVMYHPSNGTYGGQVYSKFWKDGSGHNFRTINLTHAKGGTTVLRKTYAANYMQEYYDTDLNKNLIFDGNSWKDMNGNIVD